MNIKRGLFDCRPLLARYPMKLHSMYEPMNDYGPEPFVTNIDAATRQNPNYRITEGIYAQAMIPSSFQYSISPGYLYGTLRFVLSYETKKTGNKRRYETEVWDVTAVTSRLSGK